MRDRPRIRGSLAFVDLTQRVDEIANWRLNAPPVSIKNVRHQEPFLELAVDSEIRQVSEKLPVLGRQQPFKHPSNFALEVQRIALSCAPCVGDAAGAMHHPVQKLDIRPGLGPLRRWGAAGPGFCQLGAGGFGHGAALGEGADQGEPVRLSGTFRAERRRMRSTKNCQGLAALRRCGCAQRVHQDQGVLALPKIAPQILAVFALLRHEVENVVLDLERDAQRNELPTRSTSRSLRPATIAPIITGAMNEYQPVFL